MSKTEFPRMAVLRSLYDLTGAITPNRFITSRPPAVDEAMQEFLLIRLPQAIRQPGDTFQTTYGQMAVFVRDVQGMENTLRLEQMQSEVSSLFPVRTPEYLASRPTLLPGGADGAGFHSLIIQFGIRIHKDFDIHPEETITL